jgi:hypothetical protein
MLAYSERSDAVICSAACRLTAHRNGSKKKQRALAGFLDILPALIRRTGAMFELIPELEAEVLSGKRKIDDDEVRHGVWAAYWKRVEQAAGIER